MRLYLIIILITITIHFEFTFQLHLIEVIMNKYIKLILLAIGVSQIPAAHADENLFAYTYTADTIPKDAVEFNSAITNRWDKGRGKYYAADLDFELEYGVTDKFQIAGYPGKGAG